MVKYDYNIKKDFLTFSLEQKKIILIAIFCVAGVLSDILAVKVINAGYFTIELGCVLFPLIYVLNDSICETYGEATMLKTSLLGMSMKILMVLVTTIAVLAPYDPTVFLGQEHLSYVFGFVPRIVIASLTGYALGSFVNARLMTVVGNYTNGKYLFARNIISTLGGELIDTILFIGIAFYGSLPFEHLIVFIFTQYVLKVGIEVILQPLTFRIVKWVRGNEKMIDYKREDLSF